MRERSRLRRRTAAAFDTLEPRTLLSATVVQPVPNAVLRQDVPQSIDLSSFFGDSSFPGTLVQMQTSLGAITLELDDSVAPLTVANFLNYVNDGLYNGTIVHRVVNDDPPNEFRIMQGGGFDPTGNPIPTPFGTVPNEFNLSNVRGTIAMAKLADDPNSATSQWFINDSDNTFLDSSDGGFTVFGQVIDGMSVVDQITQLQTVDGTGLNPQFDNSLPVQTPVSVGAVPRPSDLVQVQSASVLPKVTLSASSLQPDVLTASLSGTQLTLTPKPGVSGFAFVSVTATDLSGHSAADTFRVEIDPTGARALDVTLGAGHSRSVRFTEADHSTGTIQLSGPGTAVIHFGGDAIRLHGTHVLGGNVAVVGIDCTGTTAASSLTIIGRGGKDHIVLMSGISTTGAFGSMKIVRAVIQGDVNVPGGVGTFRCDLAHNGTLNLGTPLARHKVQIIAGTYFDENVVTTAPIQQIRAGNWYNSDSVSETVQAPLLRKLVSFGDFTPGIQLTGAPGQRALGSRVVVLGAIGGHWVIPGGVSTLTVGGVALDFNSTFPTPLRSMVVKGIFAGSLTAPSIGSLKITNQMLDASLTLTAPGRDLGTLSVKKGISASIINTAGSIGTINAQSLNGSNIYAGITASAGQTSLPLTVDGVTAANFAVHASISSITLSTSGAATFLNSNILAWTLGILTLGATGSENSGVPFGIATSSFTRFAAVDKSAHKSLVFTNIHDPATLLDQIEARKLVLTDLQIDIV